MNPDQGEAPAATPPVPAFCYRVTKYNPSDRDARGYYVGSEDVFSDHGSVEAAYLASVAAFAKEAGVSSLTVREPGVSGHMNFGMEPSIVGDGLAGLFPGGPDSFYDGAQVSMAVGLELLRVMLRDNGAWCRLEVDERFWIHVGYDQYVFVSSSVPCPNAVAITRRSGLFPEEIRSSPMQWEPDEDVAVSADDDFWNDLRTLTGENGSLLLEESLVQNSSRWHRVAGGNLESVRASLAARSRLYIWPDLPTDVKSTMRRRPRDTVRLIWENQAGLISSRYVEPAQWKEVREFLSDARAVAVMSTDADDLHPVRTGVLPDADGVLRARWVP